MFGSIGGWVTDNLEPVAFALPLTFPPDLVPEAQSDGLGAGK